MGLLSLFSNFFSSSKQSTNQSDRKSKHISELESDFDVDSVFISKDATILVVDDSKTHVAACKKWLSEEGYNTLTAYDGREGIQAAQKEQPDLILMDIVMPNVNGFQATRYLKKQASTKHIPIILVSGEEQYSGKIWAKKLGACSFLVKPLKRDQLFRVISRVLDHYSTAKAI